MQDNCNAVCNNMSMLALHTFEFGNYMQSKLEDQEVKEKVTNNILAHASFIQGKSESMSKRLQKATQARFGRFEIPTPSPTRGLKRR